MSYFEHMASYIGGNGFRSVRLPVVELAIIEPGALNAEDAAKMDKMVSHGLPFICKVFGTFVVMMASVTDDGAVFVCNAGDIITIHNFAGAWALEVE